MLVVTPNGLGVAGNERRGGKLVPVTHARATALLARPRARRRPTAETTRRRAAIDGVRQVAKAGGHPLPEQVDAGRRRLGTARRRAEDGGSAAGSSPEIVAALFFLAWLVFEVVATLRERRAKTAADLPPRRMTELAAHAEERWRALARRPLAPRRARPLARAPAALLALVTTQVADWFVMTDELLYERLGISVAQSGVAAPARARQSDREPEPALPGADRAALRRRRRAGLAEGGAPPERVPDGLRRGAGVPARAARARARRAGRSLVARPQRGAAVDRARVVPAHRGGRVSGVPLGRLGDGARGRGEALARGCARARADRRRAARADAADRARGGVPRGGAAARRSWSTGGAWRELWRTRRPLVVLYGAGARARARRSRSPARRRACSGTTRRRPRAASSSGGSSRRSPSTRRSLALTLAFVPFLLGAAWLQRGAAPRAARGASAPSPPSALPTRRARPARGGVVRPPLRRRARQGSLRLLRRAAARRRRARRLPGRDAGRARASSRRSSSSSPASRRRRCRSTRS